MGEQLTLLWFQAGFLSFASPWFALAAVILSYVAVYRFKPTAQNTASQNASGISPYTCFCCGAFYGLFGSRLVCFSFGKLL